MEGIDCSRYDRNIVKGFACRAKRNLDFILKQHAPTTGVHHVTQVILSTLGLIILPWERNKHEPLVPSDLRMQRLVENGWPPWMPPKDVNPERFQEWFDDVTLLKFMEQLRHSIAHADFEFDSNARDIAAVTITFRNREKSIGASIRARELALFCQKLYDLLLTDSQ